MTQSKRQERRNAKRKKKTAPRQIEPENLSANSAVRRIVFISHSNPEDNDFTTWLAARLALAGLVGAQRGF